MNKFPPNPENGTIFELTPGVFFQFDSSTNSWNRIEGRVTPPLATHLADGLMDNEDLKKLNRLIVPPPQSTITAEGCENVFEAGIISFSNSDDLIIVEGESPLYNSFGAIETESVNYQMHQHTNFFDFKIDNQELFNYMVENDKFRVASPTGPKGIKGVPGEDGEDMVPYGPDGPKGDPGSNFPVDFSLIEERVDFEVKKKYKRALISLEVNLISNDEYEIVGKRANVGNPEACPDRIRLSADTASTWLLAVRDLENTGEAVNFNAIGGDANCVTCNTELYYVDIEPIINSIKAEFDREVLQLKTGFENIVEFWLQIMSGLFDEQKASLCCALEYCRSQKRNNTTRQYIESQRVQAHQAGSTIAIDGDPIDADKRITIMDAACEPDGFGENTDNGIPNNADPQGGPACVAGLIVDPETNTVIQYPECPPGFVPMDEARDRYDGPAADGSIFIRAIDPRFQKTLQSARGDTTPALANKQSISVTNLAIHQDVMGDGFIHYDLWYVSGMGQTPEQGSLGNMALTGNKDIDGGKCLKFTDSILPGVYNLYLVNRSTESYPVLLRIASQNAQFVTGGGDGWSGSFIKNDYVDKDGISYSAGSVIEAASGPEKGEGWWLQVRVNPDTHLQPPYSKKCGAIGPIPTKVDSRLCKEVPKGMKNPLARETDLDLSYRGAMREWVTSKCGDYLVPDAIEIVLGSCKVIHEEMKVILCRTNSGNYTGGFNIGSHSGQIIVEQQDMFAIKPAASRFYNGSTKDSYVIGDTAGSNKYKCTFLMWDNNDCDGNAVAFNSDITSARCDKWSINGTWHDKYFGSLDYNAYGLQNDVKFADTNSASSTELLLYVNGRKNTKDPKRKAVGQLPRGRYIADIINCCLKSGNQYTGHAMLGYNNNGTTEELKFPNFGSFDNEDKARDEYVGLVMIIEHSGGPVYASLSDSITHAASGEIIIRFSNIDDAGANDMFVTVAPSVDSTIDNCLVSAKNVKLIERCWKENNCVGAVATIGGQDYIIICPAKPIETQCHSRFDKRGLAFAWPTFDNDSFVGVPDSGSVNFKYDEELEKTALHLFEIDKVNSANGNLDKIKTILFPTSIV
jgi:hypothetical protein